MQVINAFKKLHRTRQYIFEGDDKALELGRKEINERFKQNMKETNVDNIKKVSKLYCKSQNIVLISCLLRCYNWR